MGKVCQQRANISWFWIECVKLWNRMQYPSRFVSDLTFRNAVSDDTAYQIASVTSIIAKSKCKTVVPWPTLDRSGCKYTVTIGLVSAIPDLFFNTRIIIDEPRKYAEREGIRLKCFREWRSAFSQLCSSCIVGSELYKINLGAKFKSTYHFTGNHGTNYSCRHRGIEIFAKTKVDQFERETSLIGFIDHDVLQRYVAIWHQNHNIITNLVILPMVYSDRM